MKINFILLLILFLSSCSTGQENQPTENKPTVDTVKVQNQIPEFDIVFPKTGYTVQKKVTNAPGEPTVTNWLLEGKDANGPFMYFVAHNKMPKELKGLISQPDQLDVALQGMLTGSASKLGGFDFGYNKTSYQEHAGMTSTCKVFEGEGMIKSVVYVIGDDLFFISGGGKNIDEDQLNAFLGSFKLKE